MKEISGYKVVVFHLKDVWKSVEAMSGAQYVIDFGTTWMQELYAGK